MELFNSNPILLKQLTYDFLCTPNPYPGPDKGKSPFDYLVRTDNGLLLLSKILKVQPTIFALNHEILKTALDATIKNLNVIQKVDDASELLSQLCRQMSHFTMNNSSTIHELSNAVLKQARGQEILVKFVLKSLPWIDAKILVDMLIMLIPLLIENESSDALTSILMQKTTTGVPLLF